MKTTIEVDPANRSHQLNYYHAHKEVMNLQCYINKVNRNGNQPLYAYRVAYELYQDATGKWCFPDKIKQKMKDMAAARVAAETQAAHAQQAPTVTQVEAQ